MTYEPLLPPPVDLGAPPKFSSWREGQDRAVLDGLHNDKRIIVHNAPTGAGKQLLGIATHLLNGGRTAILTATKALQDQAEKDFASIHLVDIKGANNYACIDGSPGTRCDDGHCHYGKPCDLMWGGCLYYDKRRLASRANLVSTNYSYWLHQYEYGEGLGAFNLQVCDEAHLAPEEIAKFVKVVVTDREAQSLGMNWPLDNTPQKWIQWWKQAQDRAEALEMQAAGNKAKVKAARNLAGKLDRLLSNDAATQWIRDDNVLDRTWEPLWPGKFAESHLFRGTPKVLLTSATIVPKGLELLGLHEDDYAFIEHESTFPASSCPVYYWDVEKAHAIRLRKGVSDEVLKRWIQRIDSIIESRLDRKGLIHAVSYPRAKLIKRMSRFGHLMMLHERGEAADALREFKEAKAPCIQVSPAMTTGIDLPGDQCEWIIVAKVPFPVTEGNVMKARLEADPDYGNYIAMTTLVQAVGRGMRSVDDRCETFIVDDQAKWFLWKYRKYAPRYFRDLVQSIQKLPPLPPKLARVA